MLIVWAVMKVDSVTWTVHIDWSWPIKGQRNAFQEPMKVITPIAARNAPEFGTTIRQYVPPVAESVDAGRLLELLREAPGSTAGRGRR